MAPVQIFSGGLGGQVTPDGYSVNTSQPPYQPSGIAPGRRADRWIWRIQRNRAPGLPLPPQTSKTIGDTLSAKGMSWAWYAGGWNAALADGSRPPSEKRRSSTPARTTP